MSWMPSITVVARCLFVALARRIPLTPLGGVRLPTRALARQLSETGDMAAIQTTVKQILIVFQSYPKPHLHTAARVNFNAHAAVQ
eukprot:4014873-Pyramimonas_sp.AAC.1